MQPAAAFTARVLGVRSMLLSSLRGYRSSWMIGDLVAALTLLAIAVPEQLATARLAGMPPITGFYAFVAGSVMFALLGSNPQMSVGADSTIAPLFAVGIATVASAISPRLRGVGRNPRGDGGCDGGPGRSAAAGVGRRVSVDADHQRIPWRGCGDHRRAPAT